MDATNRSMTSWYTMPLSSPKLVSRAIGANARSIKGGKTGDVLVFGSYHAESDKWWDEPRNRLTTERIAWFR